MMSKHLRKILETEPIEASAPCRVDMGGTLVNINVVDRDTILAAHEDPSNFPDLIVRVTGFSAYFASLSEELRQSVVDRIVEADGRIRDNEISRRRE